LFVSEVAVHDLVPAALPTAAYQTLERDQSLALRTIVR
jgi:hypothetical protein